MIAGLEGRDHAALKTPSHPFAAADAHIHVPLEQLPFAGWADEPFLLGHLIGQRLPHARDRSGVARVQMEGAMHHWSGRRFLSLPCMRDDLFCQLVERRAPSLRRAGHHPRAGRIDQRIGLHDIHPGSIGRVGEVDFGVRPEQRPPRAVGDVHVDHEPGMRRDFDEFAAQPMLLAGGRPHADVKGPADPHLHRRVGDGERLRAEPALDVVGGTPRFEDGLSSGVKDPGKPERLRLLRRRLAVRLMSLSHCRLLRFPGSSGTRPTGRGDVPTRFAGH